jgi:hypothetical protein
LSRLTKRGGGPNLAQTRLYVYPDLATRELHLLTIGDKGTQKVDIQLCKSFVVELRGKVERDHGEEKDI